MYAAHIPQIQSWGKEVSLYCMLTLYGRFLFPSGNQPCNKIASDTMQTCLRWQMKCASVHTDLFVVTCVVLQQT